MTRHRDPEIAAEWIRGAFGWIVITFVAILAIPVLIVAGVGFAQGTLPPGEAGADEVVLLRTIDYTWLHDGRYLLAFASISGLPGPDYRPITDAMTLLVTTMLDALTWPTADGEVSS